MSQLLADIIEQAEGQPDVKLKFLNRLDERRLTRSENPASHFCVYFAAFDPAARKVFIGLHKKSGLWLFNGGHLDEGEQPLDAVRRETEEEWGIRINSAAIPPVQLVTLTEIENPQRQTCEWHYDLWYFLAFANEAFRPSDALLGIEFSEYGWKSYEEAAELLRDHASTTALTYLRNLK